MVVLDECFGLRYA
jgi:hypothetical protein